MYKFLKISLILLISLFVITTPYKVVSQDESESESEINLIMPYIEATGELIGISVVEAYFSIGSSGDAYVGNCMNKDGIQASIEINRNFVNGVKNCASKLKDISEEGSEEIATANDIISACNYLLEEIKYLEAFIESESEDDAKKFDNARQNAWSIIKKFSEK